MLGQLCVAPEAVAEALCKDGADQILILRWIGELLPHIAKAASQIHFRVVALQDRPADPTAVVLSQ